MLPDKVPEERRAAVGELLARINYGLIVGNFEIDLTDGEVRFKASVDFGGGEPSVALLKPLVATSLAQFDRWLPALRAVAGGQEEPAPAFQRGYLSLAAAAPASASRRRAISIAAASVVAPVASAWSNTARVVSETPRTRSSARTAS